MLVALLRGVNVGGAHKMPMARLRSVCEGLGFQRVATFIQSGNVVFEADDAGAAAECLESAVEREFGFRAAVITRSAEELRELVEGKPFSHRDGARVIVTFLKIDPGERIWEAVRTLAAGPEEIEIHGREIVVYFPDGQGKSKFPMVKIERVLGCATTSRNWNTVEKLLQMAEAGAGSRP